MPQGSNGSGSYGPAHELIARLLTAKVGGQMVASHGGLRPTLGRQLAEDPAVDRLPMIHQDLDFNAR